MFTFALAFLVGVVLGLTNHRGGGGQEAIILGVQGLGLLLVIYFNFGQAAIMLNIAGGNNPSIGELFVSPLLAGKLFLGWAVLGIVMLISAITIVGPIIIAMMFWPFTYMMIEKNDDVFGTMREAYEVTAGHRMSMFGLTIVTSLAATALTVFTCGLGAFIAGPCFALMFPVTYLVITGRRTADRRGR